MKKTIVRLATIRERTSVSPYYDMRGKEMAALLIIAKNDPMKAIYNSFRFGYEKGRRALLSEQKRNNR